MYRCVIVLSLTSSSNDTKRFKRYTYLHVSSRHSKIKFHFNEKKNLFKIHEKAATPNISSSKILTLIPPHPHFVYLVSNSKK